MIFQVDISHFLSYLENNELSSKEITNTCHLQQGEKPVHT